MIFTMHLNKQAFDLIASGKKTIEMRLFDTKRQSMGIGDTIEFINRDNKKQRAVVEITGKHIYYDFAGLYADYDKKELGYAEDEIADPKDMEKYYPLDKQHENGVVGLEFRLIEVAIADKSKTKKTKK